MKGYGQFCPVAKGAEVFAERWTPLWQHAFQRSSSRRAADVAQLAQPATEAARTDWGGRAQARAAGAAISPHPGGARIRADRPPVGGMGPALVPLPVRAR